MAEKRRLVAGLGNPGVQYAHTRHNIGFLVVRAYAESKGWSFQKQKRFKSAMASGMEGERKVDLLLPQTYMNLSGEALRAYASFYGVALEDLLIVTDDIAIPFGTMRLRRQGSSGGHNGLKSIEAHLGSKEYPRLRMGVGERKEGELTDHVLGRFAPWEQEGLEEFINLGVKAIDHWLREDFSRAMHWVSVHKILAKQEDENDG